MKEYKKSFRYLLAHEQVELRSWWRACKDEMAEDGCDDQVTTDRLEFVV